MDLAPYTARWGNVINGQILDFLHSYHSNTTYLGHWH